MINSNSKIIESTTIAPITILTDNPEFQKPTEEFEKLADIITGIIEGSDPEFTIGIYGKWGTGKTTLMRTIQKKLQYKEEFQFDEEKIQEINLSSIRKIFTKIPGVKQIYEDFTKNNPEDTKNLKNLLIEKYPTVWFNAWRYEREKSKATIPLLITIIEKLILELDQKEKYPTLNKTGLKIIDFLKSCEYHLQVGIPGLTFDIKKPSEEQSDYSSEKNIRDIPIPTIQKGLDIIQELISTFDDDKNFRIVVFIDDLDRCSPKTAIEVFESVKILLNIKGMVHVMGLSHETVEKLIKHQFKIHKISGEEYIQKIIQLPISIPEWQPKNIKRMLEDNILKKLKKTSEYYETIKNQENLITTVAKSNPREAKRIVNQFIVDFEFFKLSNPDEITLNLSQEDKNNKIFSIFVISLLRIMKKNELIQILSENNNTQKELKKMLEEISKMENKREYGELIHGWNNKKGEL